MQVILHGDNTIHSRQALVHLKQTFKTSQPNVEIIYLNGKKLSLFDLIQATESPSLYGSDRLIILEDLFRCPSKTTLSQALQFLSDLSTQYSLIIWESKLIPVSQLKKLPHFTPQLFKYSSVTFKFLDQVYPRNALQYLPLYRSACLKDSPELVFHMLVRQLRLLITVSEPLNPLPPWQIGKIKKQAASFTSTQLIRLHDALTDLDWRNKSGQTVGTFASELETVLIKNI